MIKNVNLRQFCSIIYCILEAEQQFSLFIVCINSKIFLPNQKRQRYYLQVRNYYFQQRKYARCANMKGLPHVPFSIMFHGNNSTGQVIQFLISNLLIKYSYLQIMTSHLLTVLILLLSIQGVQCFKNILSIGIPSEQVLVSDITHQILVSRASRALNSTYLDIFQGEILTQYRGIIFGFVGKRALVSMPVRLAHKSCSTQINVIFKVDTGAPISSLKFEALNKLFANCPKVAQTFNDDYAVIIAGHTIRVQESQAHFQTVNILGANFLEEKNCRLEFDYLKFGGGQFKIILQGSKLANYQRQEF